MAPRVTCGTSLSGLRGYQDVDQEPTDMKAGVDALVNALIEALLRMAFQDRSGQQSGNGADCGCPRKSSTPPVSSAAASGPTSPYAFYPDANGFAPQYPVAASQPAQESAANPATGSAIALESGAASTQSSATSDAGPTQGPNDASSIPGSTDAAATRNRTTSGNASNGPDWAGNSFHYQCVNIANDLPQLKNSKTDTMFVETRNLTDSQIRDLQTKSDGSHRNVFAYQSMSETSNWNGTGNAKEYNGAQAAGIIKGANPSWPDCKYVDVTSPAWKNLMVQRAQEVAKSGADGMMLDTMDGWNKVGGDPSANKAAMAGIVEAMASAAKQINPNFKLVVNNASDLARDNPEFANSVDGFLRENAPVTADDKAQAAAGKALFIESYGGTASQTMDGSYLHENQASNGLADLPAT